MGVTDAFDVGDFGYLAKQTPLRVSGVKHKSIVEVNIQGTEGAAATGKIWKLGKYKDEISMTHIMIISIKNVKNLYLF